MKDIFYVVLFVIFSIMGIFGLAYSHLLWFIIGLIGDCAICVIPFVLDRNRW